MTTIVATLSDPKPHLIGRALLALDFGAVQLLARGELREQRVEAVDDDRRRRSPNASTVFAVSLKKLERALFWLQVLVRTSPKPGTSSTRSPFVPMG